jgi:hypothetical protein
MSTSQKQKSLGSKIGAIFGKKKSPVIESGAEAFVADLPPDTPEDILEMMREYEKVKTNPRQPITGWDFDRAFRFIEKYPESRQTQHLIEEMLDTSSQQLKGLSYESAAKVLQTMPLHPGSEAILRGIYKLEKEYIKELTSDIIMFLMEIAPDHPEIDALGEALVYKNFTNAYGFIEANPNHPQTKDIIAKMFKKDANIATLLLKEKMDHEQVQSIFEGIYGISPVDVQKLMPDAIIFILEVAPDHKYERAMVVNLVEKNYIKAFDFVKSNPEHPHSPYMRKLIIRKKPELEQLL